MRRLLFGVAIAAAVLVLPITAGAGGPATDGAPTAGIDTGSALVLLNGEPLSTYVKTRPAPGKKIDFASKSTKSYRAQLSAFRNEFKQWLHANRAKSERHRRVRSGPERRRREAERGEPWNASFGTDGAERGLSGSLHASGP